jgi:hypothetical protein
VTASIIAHVVAVENGSGYDALPVIAAVPPEAQSDPDGASAAPDPPPASLLAEPALASTEVSDGLLLQAAWMIGSEITPIPSPYRSSRRERFVRFMTAGTAANPIRRVL